MTASTQDVIGVVIANTGTPDEPTPKAVKSYLAKFLMDPRIVPMNRVAWWLLLHLVILRARAKKSAKKYEKIWTPEGFSFKLDHEKLARGLESYYEEHGVPVNVEVAMSYGHPSHAEALGKLKQKGCKRVVLLPLYPQSAYSTCAAATDAFKAALREIGWDVPSEIIDNYHEDPVYIKAIAASIRNAGFDPESDDRLLMSFHSIPLADIEAGDTYELQVDATSLAVAGELGLARNRWTISFQSRFDKGRTWLSPFTKPTLTMWAESGADSRVFMVCPNFSVDCLETLYDVEYELKPLYLDAKHAYEAGKAGSAKRTAVNDAEDSQETGTAPVREAEGAVVREAETAASREAGTAPARDDEFVYVPCLNRSKAHLKVLTHVLAPYVGEVDE